MFLVVFFTIIVFLHIDLQGDGAMFCGLHVDNGRIGGIVKKTLREIIENYNLNVRLTPNQNIILCDIDHSWKEAITMALTQAGLLVKLFPLCTFWIPKYSILCHYYIMFHKTSQLEAWRKLAALEVL